MADTPRFNPFSRVSSRYGAAMGRVSYLDLPWTENTDLCARGQGGDGAYDSGGVYWGYGGVDGPVWAVWERGNGAAGVVYVRALDKASAVVNARRAVLNETKG